MQVKDSIYIAWSRQLIVPGYHTTVKNDAFRELLHKQGTNPWFLYCIIFCIYLRYRKGVSFAKEH